MIVDRWTLIGVTVIAGVFCIGFFCGWIAVAELYSSMHAIAPEFVLSWYPEPSEAENATPVTKAFYGIMVGYFSVDCVINEDPHFGSKALVRMFLPR